jgi:hypothetical protein
MNANDARIAKLTVAQTGGDIQEVAPNAPATGVGPPAPNFDLVSAYDLTCRSAYDLTCWFAGSLAG